jgi:peroxiredoxin
MGTVNSDTGTIELMPVASENSYYLAGLGSRETKIIHGKFEFTDSISYPLEFRLGLKINSLLAYISDYFFVDPGVQDIVFDAGPDRLIPHISNMSMSELEKYSTALTAAQDDSHGSSPDQKKFLLAYTKDHPSSYIALWELINIFSRGYEQTIDSIYSEFSGSVKNSYTGKVLGKRINGARITAIGNSFPKLTLLNEKNEKVLAPIIAPQNKFTLVDFWYSHCGPCISQFKDLKNIFETYHVKGFAMVGISTDHPQYVPDWKKAIKEYELPWEQYLDLGEVEANKLSLGGYPSNFLLDNKGKIIAKDILPAQLNAFLAKNMQ